MRLAYTGREYIRFEIEDGPDQVISVSFDSGLNWYDAERVSTTEVRLLVAAPGATGNPGGTVVLPVGFYGIFLRLIDGVETVYRPAGNLEVDSDIGA
jgi:hypothetical protein